jgi:hypothetical protein
MRPLAVLAAMLVAMLVLPAGAQNNTTGGNVAKDVSSCPDTGNNVNQAQNAQNCPDGSQNSKARTTSKGGNSGQQRHPGVNK